MPTLRAEQIKKTKTILRDYIRETQSPQKMQANNLSMRIFCGTGFYKRQEEKIQREEKR
jgi:hypothetical protein